MSSTLGPASKKQEMILNSEAQITLIGGAAGSGKSYLLQMLPLKYIDCPKMRAIMFRRTTPQLTGQGGIIETAQGMYLNLPKQHRPTFTKKPPEAKFPTGCTVRWQHMEHVKNKFDIQGLQFTFIGVDEACQFEWEQLEYMMSRLRSESKYPSRMVMSCNPDPDHELRQLIEGFYLDDEGYPIPERDGVVRYFIRRDGEFLWGDSREDLGRRYAIPEERWSSTILSFTFISATIYDNPVMLEQRPEYLAFLEGLNEVDKAQLLHGNWFARPATNSYFHRDNLIKVDKVPLGARYARGYDKASQRFQPGSGLYPDYTATIKMAKCRDGYYYLLGDCLPEFKDDDTDVHGRFRKSPGERDQIIKKQGFRDGSDCEIVLPCDPGAAGKVEFEEACKKLIEAGLTPRKDPAVSNTAKLTKFTPFAVACEHGLVRIVESSFSNAISLDKYLGELEAFDGERSGSSKKDDWADATATVFAHLSKKRVVNIVPRNQSQSKTQAADLIDSHKVAIKDAPNVGGINFNAK